MRLRLDVEELLDSCYGVGEFIAGSNGGRKQEYKEPDELSVVDEVKQEGLRAACSF